MRTARLRISWEDFGDFLLLPAFLYRRSLLKPRVGSSRLKGYILFNEAKKYRIHVHFADGQGVVGHAHCSCGNQRTVTADTTIGQTASDLGGKCYRPTV